MKKLMYLFVLAIAIPQFVISQGNKIDQTKIGFITQRLNLTSAEAEKFWPIYNEFRNKSKELKKGRRNDFQDMQSGENISDKELETLLSELLQSEQKLLDLRKEYVSKFKQVLPIKKVVLLLQAEREFNKEMINLIQKK